MILLVTRGRNFRETNWGKNIENKVKERVVNSVDLCGWEVYWGR